MLRADQGFPSLRTEEAFMSRSIQGPVLSAALLTSVAVGLLVVACEPAPVPANFDELAEASLAQIEGAIDLPGLQEEVEVIRDQWGVPHIYAGNLDDLFFAQGFIQAQDRLWQMDMYHRVFAGRLAETFGPDYVEHDRVARLVRYRGPWDDAEWTSYHPEGKRVFDAFAAGVNAFIDHAGDQLPVEFVLSGLEPLRWTAETSVMRTQTAMPLGDARSELNRVRDLAEDGPEEAIANLRPVRPLTVPVGLDVDRIAALGRTPDGAVQTGFSPTPTGGLRVRSSAPDPELVEPYAGWLGALASENNGVQENSPGSNNWVISGALTASGEVIVANDPHRSVSNPSIRYIVHLNAPGWDVVGATEAPLPGVAIGHNGSIAWGLTIVGTDQSDVYVEEVNPEDPDEVLWQGEWEPLRVEVDTIAVLGEAPRIVEQRFSRHGPVFYRDEEGGELLALRSTMHEPGTAGYLGALQLAQVRDCTTFLDRLRYWKAPTENMICGDASGDIAWQASALSPARDGWHGRLPVPGTGDYEWTGFRTDLPREFNPDRGWIGTANNDIHPAGYDPPLFFKGGGGNFPRYERLVEVLGGASGLTMDDMRALQMDAYSASAAERVEAFRGWTGSTDPIESARVLLADWDGVYALESAGAALYREVTRGMGGLANAPSPEARQTLLEGALTAGLERLIEAQGSDPGEWRWGRSNQSEFPHDFVSAFDIAPRERPGGAGTVASTGATYRQIIDFADLDGSLVTNAPGQSAQPGSPFYDNLAEGWAVGDYFPLLFSRDAVEENAAHRLVLRPGR